MKMKKQIKGFLINGYARTTLLFQNASSVLKNERGESRGVGAMVGVMIAVGIAVIIWGLVSGWLPTFWSKITGKADTIG